jgi:hypothetical protein
MSEFPREPRVSILNNDPIADLDALNIEDPDVSSAPGIIWFVPAHMLIMVYSMALAWH